MYTVHNNDVVIVNVCAIILFTSEGQVYAVMAMAETLVVLAAAPLYKTVYSATLDSRAATYNFLSAGFNMCLTLILL